jgi:hypothetical protein
VGSSNSVGRWGRPTTARRTPDRTQIIWGIFGGQEGETDYCTAHAESDPNYLGKASMEGNAVVRCEFGHVGDGRRADSSTRFPGASSYLRLIGLNIKACTHTDVMLTKHVFII